MAFVFIVMGWVGDIPFLLSGWFNVSPSVWWHIIPLTLMVVPMLLRVRHPAIAMLLGMAIVAVDFTIGFNMGILLCVCDLIYGFALRTSRRTVLTGTLVLSVFPIGALGLAFSPIIDAEDAVSLALLMFAIFILPIWWAYEVRRGLPLWQEHDTHEKLKADRHASVLRAQAAQRQTAIEAERRAMARELHDVVSSQVSAIAITSGAVLNAPVDAERDRRALESVRRSSLGALDQLSEMVRLLRQNGPDLSYAELPGSTTWDDILASARSHGLAVDVRGHPPHHLSPTQHHVLLRVLQESLTNGLKYGDGSADVALREEKGQIRLRITSPLGGAAGEVGMGAGTGLVAMRERVELGGGRFHTATEEGRWLVEVEMPSSGEPNHHRGQESQ